jgi:hypothetical protein
MQKSKLKCLVVYVSFYALSFVANPCFAKDIKFGLSVESNKVSVGVPFQLNLTFDGTQGIPALEMPAIEGFDIRYVGPSTRLSIINGQASSSITHTYSLVPLKTGTFKIGPLQFKYKGDSYFSEQIAIEVVAGQAQGYSQPGQGQQAPAAAPVDISDRAFVVIQTKKNRVYLNELLPLTVKLYVNRLALRDIQYPELAHEGFSVGNYEQPRQYQETYNGAPYDVIEFNAMGFGIKAGDFRLGPAVVKCNLLLKRGSTRRMPWGDDDFFNHGFFDDFFSQYEARPLNLKSADIPISVLAIPEENKPVNYSGAVGYFELEASVSPPEVKVGDPLTLRIVIRGEGNFNTVNMPSLAATGGFKVYEPQVRQEKNEKIFEQILMPLQEDIREVPQVAFSYFNASEGKFATLLKGPFPIKVIKPERQEEQKVVEAAQGNNASLKEEKIGRDIIYIKASSGRFSSKGAYLYRSRLFFAFQIFILLIFVGVLAWQKRSERLRTDIRYARGLLAPRKAREGLRRARAYLDKQDTGKFYDAVFSTLQGYLGDKFNLPSQGITVSVIDDVLKNKGIAAEVLEKLRDIFRHCDIARFAPGELHREDMLKTIQELEEAIDFLERQRS